MNKIRENLQIFGLKEKEIKVYLYLLSNKDMPAYKISTGTNVPRTTVYKILESLEKQGLVSKWLKNSVKYFSAESPNKLEQLIQTKRDALEQIMPNLKEIFNDKTLYPTTKLFLGKEGVKHSFNHMLEKGVRNKINKIYAISEPQLTEVLPKFFLKWRDEKNKKLKSFTYLIVNKGVSGQKNYTSDDFRETRELPKESPINGSLDIVGQYVYFFSFKDKEIYSIIIDSPIISTMMTQLFKYVWDTLEK